MVLKDKATDWTNDTIKERFLLCIGMLHLHGMMTDSERDKVQARLIKEQGKQAGEKEIKAVLTTEQEGINILKSRIPAGEEFGTSRVQRLLRWGYNRSYRTMLIAIETGQAEHGKNESLFKFVKK